MPTISWTITNEQAETIREALAHARLVRSWLEIKARHDIAQANPVTNPFED